MRISIKTIDEDLKRERYIFSFHEHRHGLVLVTFMYEERETKRHKFKAKKVYNRLSHEDSAYDFSVKRLKVDDVQWSKDIEEKAKSELIQKINILKK